MNAELPITNIKAFVPAKDFERSKRFYQDLGFTVASSEGGIAFLHVAECSFLLQDFYEKTHAECMQMHLLTPDVNAWWSHVQTAKIVERYAEFGVRTVAPQLQPWGMLDFVIVDPSGVCWRIAENVPRHEQ